jgi:hypothetical protein
MPTPGRTMGDFMTAPAAIMADKAALKDWIARARTYVASLPPKAPKKSARAGKRDAPTAKGSRQKR